MNQYISAFFQSEDEALIAASKIKQAVPCDMISIKAQNEEQIPQDGPFSDFFVPYSSLSYSSLPVIPETFNFHAVSKHDHLVAEQKANTHAVVCVKTTPRYAPAAESILLSCGGQSVSKTNIP